MKDTNQTLKNYLSKQLKGSETQTESDTSKELNKQLLKAQHLMALNSNPDYQEFLLPHLKECLDNKWLDPLSFPNQEEFYRAYLQYRAKATVYAELINFLAGQEQVIKNIQKRLEPRKSSI